jgi:hypothetical protein
VGPGRVGPQGRQWSVRKGDAEGVDSWPTTNLCLKDFLHSAWIALLQPKAGGKIHINSIFILVFLVC